jgi:hypothetical protein
MASRTKRGGVGARSSASFPLASGGGVAVAGRQGGATNRTWQAGSIDRSEEGDARTHAREGWWNQSAFGLFRGCRCVRPAGMELGL